MIIYHYDSATFMFVGAGRADPDPMEDGEFLLPAFCTPHEPEITPEGMVTVFNVAADAWVQVALPSAPVVPVIPVAENPAAEPRVITLDEARNTAYGLIDGWYGQLYNMSVVNSAIAAEYSAAFESAKAWLADTTRPAPERVKALAESYGVTNDLAAQVVVDKWTEAQSVAFDLRGAARLRAKTAIRAAVDFLGVDAAVAAGKTAMEQVTFSI